jgi:hypothetical protein
MDAPKGAGTSAKDVCEHDAHQSHDTCCARLALAARMAACASASRAVPSSSSCFICAWRSRVSSGAYLSCITSALCHRV